MRLPASGQLVSAAQSITSPARASAGQMDGEWSDGAAASSPTVSGGGESKADYCSGSPPAVSPAPPSSTTSPAAATTGTGRRRSANKRVVTVPLADVTGPRPKGVGEGNTPTDSWAWRKYGQKPIKGSPFPRAYYRCSSSKGCPARKQVERSRAEPDKVIVTYSFEHTHSDAVARAQNRQAGPKAPPKAAQQPSVAAEPAESPPSSGIHDVTADTVCGGAPSAAAAVAETEVGAAAAAVEVHDEFRWLYDGVSVTSSASPSEVEAADEMLYGAMSFFGGGAAAPPAAPLTDAFGDVGGLFDYGEAAGEEDAMFAGLGELPECAMVFQRHAGDGLSVAGGVK